MAVPRLKMAQRGIQEKSRLLIDLVDGDGEVLMFLSEWLNNGRNATKAYLKLHPNVGYHSARVLGSRQLAKVNIPDVSIIYGLGIETYIKQLKRGLEARDAEGNPDNRTRFSYLTVLGELLGIWGGKTSIT